MILHYKIDNSNLVYYPVLLNWLIERNASCIEKCIYNNYINKEFLERVNESINDILSTNSTEYILLDFSLVAHCEPRSFISYLDAFEKGTLIFYNINDEIFRFINTDLRSINHLVKYNGQVISNINGFTYFNNNNDIIKSAPLQIIRKILKCCINSDNNEYYFPSSNIYGNKYINVKNVFYNPEMYYLIIFQIAKRIETCNFRDADKLLCASYNGAVLSTLVGQLLNKEVLYIMKLGPNISFKDRELINKIESDKKYLFIGDMYCLGTEYKSAETLIKLHNASLIGGIVVAKYTLKKDNKNITSLVEIKKGDDYKYILKIK